MPCPRTQPHGIDSQMTQQRNIEYNIITYSYHSPIIQDLSLDKISLGHGKVP